MDRYRKGSMWLQLLAVTVGTVLGLWLMGDDSLGLSNSSGYVKFIFWCVLVVALTPCSIFSLTENTDSLKGKRVLVTGASGGIGEQLAYVYAEHGASVVVTARREAEINKVRDKCRDLSPVNASQFAVTADMKDYQSIQYLIKEAIGHMGGIDIVVLNHITQCDIAPFTGTQSDLDNVYNTMDINYKSYVQTAGLALPHLTESDGGLVVVNSIMGFAHSPKLAAYSASKFALDGFFGSLRSQFIMEERNVAVTMCVLGFIDTPNALKGLEQSDSTRLLRFVRPASASGTAQAIVKASAARQEVVYHPGWSIQAFTWLNRLFPGLAQFIIRELSRS